MESRRVFGQRTPAFAKLDLMFDTLQPKLDSSEFVREDIKYYACYKGTLRHEITQSF